MFEFSMKGFLRTGALGSIRLGLSRAAVYCQAGPPDSTAACDPGEHAPGTWKYGPFDFHFLLKQDQLRSIRIDDLLRNTAQTSTGDMWVIKRGAGLSSIAAHLEDAGIKYQVLYASTNGAAAILTRSRVLLTFAGEEGPGSLPGLWGVNSSGMGLVRESAPIIIPPAVESSSMPHWLWFPVVPRAPEEDRVCADSDYFWLLALLGRVRGTAMEANAWGLCLPDRVKPIPDAIAADLLKRKVALRALAYAILPPDLEWRLAGVCDTALLKLARRLFTEASASQQDFERRLEEFGARSRMLVALVYLDGQPPAKEATYLAVAAQATAPDVRQHLEIRHLIRRVQDPTTTETEIIALAATRIPRVLCAVASCVRTPRSTLSELRYTRNMPFAAHVRDLARRTLVQQARVKDPAACSLEESRDEPRG